MRHLLYNCCPIASNDEWQRNVAKLNQYAGVFTGRKIVIVREGPEMVPFETVLEAFKFDAEFRRLPNDPVLCEIPGFDEAFQELIALPGLTFYAHTKGVGRQADQRINMEAVRAWRDAMYDYNLSDVPKIEAILETHACCGCFRVIRRFPKNLLPDHESLWHYRGTFWWVRNEALRERRIPVPRVKHGIEAYPGIVFALEDSACLFYDDCKHNLYQVTVGVGGSSNS